MSKVRADKYFSLYIRLRDSTGGFAKCCTCKTVKPINEMDCGHFVGRTNMSTRFYDKNGHAQCRKCNRANHGETEKYEKFLNETYGDGTADDIRKKGNETIYSGLDFGSIADEYRNRYNELKKQKA